MKTKKITRLDSASPGAVKRRETWRDSTRFAASFIAARENCRLRVKWPGQKRRPLFPVGGSGHETGERRERDRDGEERKEHFLARNTETAGA